MSERILLAVLLCVAILLFWTQKLRGDLTALLVLLVLIMPWPHPDGAWRGVLTPQEGFSGFGSAAVIMVTAMFIFGGALVKTGAVEMVGGRLFKIAAGREWTLQAAILSISVLTSMFVNDTTVVLVLLPLILSICRERNLSPSRYLMACAYGSLLGGQWTLIGTRSNLLISDYFRARTGAGLGFFDFTPVAAAIFAIGAAYFVVAGRKVLPRHAPIKPEAGTREYLTEVIVQPESSVIGKRLEELDWAKREDMEVVEMLRDQATLSRNAPLRAGDVLVMRGAVDAMGDLMKTRDFTLKEEVGLDSKTLQRIDLVTVEALLAPRSTYAGSTLQELQFNRSYGFTVLGISRHGRTIRRRPMTTRLEFGDSLLLLGQVDHLPRLRRNLNLILLVEAPFPAVGKRKALIMVLLLAAVIGLAIADLVSPSISIPAVAFASVVLGCIRVQDAYNAIDWPAVVTVAGMIPFGLALEKTRAASDIAEYFVNHFERLGPHAVIAVLFLLAIGFTQLIENAAVAIILAPLAYGLAEGFGLNPRTLMVGLAICVSAGFCTPFAHESTILVMGPGHYRFKHYLQIGAALAFITWMLATGLTPLVWPLHQHPTQSR